MVQIILSEGWPFILAFVLLVFLIVIIKAIYKKAPPNVAMVITGPTGTKTVIGRGVLVIPIIQRVDYMSLENIQVDFTSRDEIPTQDAINILVDAVANVSISQDKERLKIASSKFLGYKIPDIQQIVTPVLEGNIREIISQTTLKELIQGDKKALAERVVQNVSPNLQDMGLELTTFNIQNFKDKNGVIDNLGIQNTVQISKDAAKSKASAEAEVKIAEAEADRLANEARVKADREIAERNNQLDIKKSELKKEADIKKAEADAAYEIQQEEQRKTIEITTANANLARQEKAVELQEREVAIKERELEATVKKQAEADKYATQQQADADKYSEEQKAAAELTKRQKAAEAEKFEALQKAEATKAESEARKVAAENEATGIRAKGEAEAAAIQAKAEAEAAGILKKAEAMKEYGDAARQQMELETLKVYFEQLPKIAAAVADGYGNVDSIKMFGGDASKLSGNIMTTVEQVSDGLNESLGIDLKTILAGFIGGKLANNNITDNSASMSDFSTSTMVKETEDNLNQ